MDRWPGDSLAVCHGGPPVGPKHFVSVLDTRGRHGRRLNLARVETPPELVIYEIGEDYILGKVRDELEVEYVQDWGLDRSG